jgi:hypothetical protein
MTALHDTGAPCTPTTGTQNGTTPSTHPKNEHVDHRQALTLTDHAPGGATHYAARAKGLHSRPAPESSGARALILLTAMANVVLPNGCPFRLDYRLAVAH